MSSRGVNLSPDCDEVLLIVNSPNFLRVNSFVDGERSGTKLIGVSYVRSASNFN